MPELPEVETVRRSLEPHLIGRLIRVVEILNPRVIRYPSPQELAGRLQGRHFTALERRGKYLLLRLDAPFPLIIHLKMAGRLLWGPGDDPLAPHTHVILRLDDGATLRYVDVRQFGGLYLPEEDGRGTPPGLLGLGPEPLAPDFTPEYLQRALQRSGRVKGLLLDQTVIAGLGNIYVDEVLHAAGVHPERRGRDLRPVELERIYQAIREILPRAIAHQGTTFATYVDGEGRPGRFVAELQVYRQEGKPCRRCGAPVQKIRVAGRGTHLCPDCQPTEVSSK